MKRKDLVSALLKPEIADNISGPPVPKVTRMAAGSVRAMGLELGRLTEEAGQADVLRQQLATGTAVVELDPEDVEPSFIADRLAPTSDPQYRQLVDSVRRDGQKIPILVRPHQTKGSAYQVAYGHRRWYAARELGIRVRAIVQELSDADLVIAQGKENSERRSLSFIERALFAANLDARGFDRSTINAALAVQSAETTRLLTVAAGIPADLVNQIGPAPKAGRTRWMELADYLSVDDARRLATQTVEQPSFRQLGTDARFEALIGGLRAVASQSQQTEQIMNARGQPVVRVARLSGGLRLSVDERFSAGFSAYLVRLLPELIRSFDQGTDQQSKTD
jgi:ParB family chromosome partitioning protein